MDLLLLLLLLLLIGIYTAKSCLSIPKCQSFFCCNFIQVSASHEVRYLVLRNNHNNNNNNNNYYYYYYYYLIT